MVTRAVTMYDLIYLQSFVQEEGNIRKYFKVLKIHLHWLLHSYNGHTWDRGYNFIF